MRIDQVDLHDDFFQLGGDSLSAEILALELGRFSGTKLWLADILRAPTIEQQRALIEMASGPREHIRYMMIQPAGSRPPFFCDGGSAGPLFRALASRLGKDQPFLALNFPDMRRLPNPCRLQDVAAFHVETIRSVQPEGPYCIGGWSLYGLVAYEIAHQLYAARQQVSLLVIFDDLLNRYRSPGTGQPRSAWAREKLRALKRHAGVVRKLDLREISGFVAQRRSSLDALAERVRHATYPARLRLGLARESELFTEFRAQLVRAATRYDPPPYAGKIALFRSEECQVQQSSALMGRVDLVVGALRIYHVPGGHQSMFLEPITACALRAELAEAQGWMADPVPPSPESAAAS